MDIVIIITTKGTTLLETKYKCVYHSRHRRKQCNERGRNTIL